MSPLDPDLDILSPKCASCGRLLADPSAHWRDLCYPVAAKVVFLGFFPALILTLLYHLWSAL